MGYKALLFCPDEKTARTVTQVLSELEFTVESCTEPFAAVKKLMSEHFDAIVVDCDNEQNATLLFKSARNSTSNQTSLAVAVVEGQAGVAKAFRIGANLVLTKPINVEQAKGTLRVARGLLRKGEPAKPAASAPTPASSKPAPTAPVLPAQPAPVAPAAVTPRPAAPPAARPAPSPSPAPATVAASASAQNHDDDDLLEMNAGEAKAPAPAAAASRAVEAKPVFNAPINTPTHAPVSAPIAAPARSMSSGAASAPAPARELQAVPVPEIAPSKPEIIAEQPVESAAVASSAANSTFTFGGANVEAESGGSSKKILLIAVVVVAVAGGVYAAVNYFGGHAKPATAISTPAPSTASPAPAQPKPSVQPASAPSGQPASSASAQPNQPASQPVASASSPAKSTGDESADSDSDNSTKSAASAKTSAKAEAAPRVVKGGKEPAVKRVTPAADAAAPSIIGLAAPASGPPSNLITGGSTAFPTRLQTLNISQGVSQGLLMKKVNPVYPRSALSMHVEGTVQLMATISKTGDITAVKILSGDSQLTHAAADAVKQWKYKPYLLNGEPVEIQTQVTVKFALPH